MKTTCSSLRMRSVRSVSYALTTANEVSGQMSEAVTVISFLTYPGIFPGEGERLQEITGKAIPSRVPEH